MVTRHHVTTWLLLYTTLLLIGTRMSTGSDIMGGEFCMFDTFEAECGPNEVIEMQGALYGRMKLGKCVTSDLGYVGCSSNVLDVMDRMCSGKRKCSIKMPNEAIANRKSCFTELTMYLEANYTCRKVVSIDRTTCRSCDYVKVTEPAGDLASVLTRETGCGAPSCPWLIEVGPGKRINISVINYSWQDDVTRFSDNCQVHATVKEVVTAKSVSVCTGNQRHSHVYTSLTNSVEIRFLGREPRNAPNASEFLLHYEVLGCGDLSPPPGGWSTRNDNVITMGCNATGDSWTMTCHNGVWEGDRKQCPGYQPTTGLGRISLPSGLSVVIIVAVAFVVGAFILCIGIIWFRRRYVMSRMPAENTYASDKEQNDVIKEAQYAPPMYAHDAYDVTKTIQSPGGHATYQTTDRENYAHIWERPLPNPNVDNSCTCPTGGTYGPAMMTSQPESPQTVVQPESEYNKLGTATTAHAQKTRRMVYGNNTMARKECEILVPENEIQLQQQSPPPQQYDPRYFQLDPEKMTGEM